MLEGKVGRKVEREGWKGKLEAKFGREGWREAWKGRLEGKVGVDGWKGRLTRKIGKEDWKERFEILAGFGKEGVAGGWFWQVFWLVLVGLGWFWYVLGRRGWPGVGLRRFWQVFDNFW